MNNFYQSIINNVLGTSSTATANFLGSGNQPLKKFLMHHLTHYDGEEGSILSDPVFEATFPWEEHRNTMLELSGNLIRPSLIDALDNATDSKGDSFRFGKDWHPYVHQLRAWNSIIRDKKSAVITSGTGSGKTECFLLPVINSLVEEYETTKVQLSGIRALFIYPLNALINSQKRRLDAWTRAYNDNIRFCLYNGNTPDRQNSIERRKFPNQVICREQLREQAPPILVTNSTMLEYMLIRKEDNPILQQSKGKLRWVILDEAHTYTGSQAAELSLLLRRVLHAFNVKAEDVQFIATSATIGNKEKIGRLSQYLADLSGIRQESIMVFDGKRHVPDIELPEKKDYQLEELKKIEESSEKYQALCKNKMALKIREHLSKKGAHTLTEISKVCFNSNDEKSRQMAVEWIDLCSSALSIQGNNKIAFLPLRAHLFHKTFSGLWACSNKECSEKDDILHTYQWSFGQIYFNYKKTCNCGAPIFELVRCASCDSLHLKTQLKDSKLTAPVQFTKADEFALDTDDTYDDDEFDTSDIIENSTNQNIRLISSSGSTEYTDSLRIKKESFEISSVHQDSNSAVINLTKSASCGICNKTKIKNFALGAPFYIGNITPKILTHLPIEKQYVSKPASGRRVISFTDSRQGTARMALRLQLGAERNYIRSQIFNYVHSSSNLSDKEMKQKRELEEKIEQQTDDFIRKMLEDKLKSFQNSHIKSFEETKKYLSLDPVVSNWIMKTYLNLRYDYFIDRPEKVAELLLIKEIVGRPRRQYSLENMGLMRVVYPSLDDIKTCPDGWEKLNGNPNLSEWKDYLKIILDFYLRNSHFFEAPIETPQLVGMNIYPKKINKVDGKHKWPIINKKGRLHRIYNLLVYAFGLDINEHAHLQLMKTVSIEAFNQLKNQGLLCKQHTNDNGFWIPQKEIAFAPFKNGYICPITHKFLDVTLRGITPYIKDDNDCYCGDKVTFPSFENPEQYLFSTEINALRDNGSWGNIQDEVIKGGLYYRSIEHSAQLSNHQLSEYEQEFNEHEINLLNCSTTMEMGVDLGGITAVLMNNVPPHPANYLQRTGRAGRRKETQSLAITLCKNKQNELEVFENPLWAFRAEVNAPYVMLNSKKIVTKHIHSFLLGAFFRMNDKVMSILKNCKDFFYNDDISSFSLVVEMRKWLDNYSNMDIAERDEIHNAINKITFKTTVKPEYESIFKECSRQLHAIEKRWIDKYKWLKDEIELQHQKSAYQKKLDAEKTRIEKEFLLGYLSKSNFLPAYGFPTGIAEFSTRTNETKINTETERDDNNFRHLSSPSRSMSTAIQEYAPGANITIDGRIYQSSGILLNGSYQNTNAQAIKQIYRCNNCGYIGKIDITQSDSSCFCCNNVITSDAIVEYIEPYGFAVDYYKEPTNNVDEYRYISNEPSWLAIPEDFTPMYNTNLGQLKTSTEAMIFHHNAGENKLGYSICLKCGRSHSNDGKNTELLRKKHKKLGGGGDCNAENSHDIIRNTHIGCTDITDAAEFFFKDRDGNFLNHNKKELKVLAWSLAYVMRNEYAKLQGIDISEINCLIKPQLLNGASIIGLGFYDTNGGGAGHSSQMHKHLQKILIKTYSSLKSCNCKEFCRSCLLSHDSQFNTEYLDRNKVIEYLESIKEVYDKIPTNEQIFGDKSRYLTENIIDEIIYKSQNNAKIYLFVNELFWEWEISASILREILVRVEDKVQQITLIFPEDNLLDISLEDRKYLFSLMSNNACLSISQLSNSSTINNIVMIIEGFNDTPCKIYGHSNIYAKTLNENWLGDNLDGVIQYADVEGTSTLGVLKNLKEIDKDFLLKDITDFYGFGKELEIRNECDSNLAAFGITLLDLIKKEYSSFRENFNKGLIIKNIVYSDPYIRSPWSLLLIKSFLDVLVEDTNTSVTLLTGSSSSTKAKGLLSDWIDRDKQKNIIETFMPYNIKVVIKSNKELKHNRSFMISWSDGSETSLRLDHGFGCWVPYGIDIFSFDTQDDEVEQVRALSVIEKKLKVRMKRMKSNFVFITQR